VLIYDYVDAAEPLLAKWPAGEKPATGP